MAEIITQRYPLRPPQMEYTRFPRPPNDPPCPGERYADVARKWNIRAFRGRLLRLLAPARGMPPLPAKGGFSRPSSIRTAGSHRGLWDCDYSSHLKRLRE